MHIEIDRSAELLAADVPPGLYAIAKPGTGELVVKLHRHTNPAHYLAKQRWVNLEGTSDMTPQTVYRVTLSDDSKLRAFVKRVSRETIEYGHYGAGHPTQLAEDAKALLKS